MSGPPPNGRWLIDRERSRVAFRVKHLGVSTVEGRFTEFDGRIEVADGQLSAEGSVQVASVDTGDAHRDSLLRAADFFDADAHPRIGFATTRALAHPDAGFELEGELTMHGLTRPLKLLVSIGAAGEERLVLSAEGQLRRSDFDLKLRLAMGAGNATIGNTVTVLLELCALAAS